MQAGVTPIGNEFGTSMASYMLLARGALEPISSHHAFSAALLVVIRGTKVAACAGQCASAPASRGCGSRYGDWRRDFLLSCLAIYYECYVCGVECEYVLFIQLVHVLGISFVLGMVLQVQVNDAIKRSILNGSCDRFPTFYTVAFLAIYQLG